MLHIKKLVMHGFKSFASRVEIPFENDMNVIVGPNGSGKSNITDALCFVLGRMSIKSMRAAKAANLLFAGNKDHKPSNDAMVELVFDNSERGFSLDTNEVSIKRIVRRNGLSVYKINNETKTRQEILELMAQAGIDPNGFNIVLQGEIASLIKKSPEERRKIIEEVAGISIYEDRKQKSLREIEKTEEELKEVSAVLRERNKYMANLEKERQEAMSFQKLDENIKKCKATILNKQLKEKEKDIIQIDSFIKGYEKEIEKIKSKINERQGHIKELEEKITKINNLIKDSTSGEQETLHREIAEFKASIAALEVRKENFEARLNENRNKKQDYSQKIKDLEKEVYETKSSSPEIKKKQLQFKTNQDKFDILERERRKFYQIKSELSTLENRRQEKERLMIENKKELEIIERNISLLSEEIRHAKSFEKAESLKQQVREEIEQRKKQIESLEIKNLELEKEAAVLSNHSSREEKLKQDIVRLDICPLCKSHMTKEHINHVIENANKKLNEIMQRKAKIEEEKIQSSFKIAKLKEELSFSEIKLNELQIDIVKLKNADEKKNQIRKLSENQESLRQELKESIEKINILKKEFEKLKNIEEQYDEARLKMQELSFADVDIDTKMTLKQRELNRMQVEIKTATREIEESERELKQVYEKLSETNKLIGIKEKEEQIMYERFQKFFSDKNEFSDKQKGFETEIIGMQHEVRNNEDKINNHKIQKARLNAEFDSIKTEFKDFESFEILSMPLEEVKERLHKSQERISQIGTVNLKALEVYEQVKEQVALIEDKVKKIEEEKIKIHQIIEEIDKKKKKSFMNTLEALNALFTRNFNQLSKKGEVVLELENPQDIFAGGVNIIIKVARGKYFDVNSLSGGEKTLVALCLIFAIQEYKPYCFYVFDEIDAALDKHNSERLAALIKQYMTTGQYIIVTHNDALISEATTLYGVSMQENISKIVSLKI